MVGGAGDGFRAQDAQALYDLGYAADDRPVDDIASELARTTPEPDDGDGDGPPDGDEELRRFTEAVTGVSKGERDGGWLGGVREYVADAGPVPSSRFA